VISLTFLFATENPWLKHTPQLQPALLRLSADFPILHAHLSAVNVFWNPGQAGSQEFIYPLIAAVTGPILTFAPPAFLGVYSRNWPLPRSMARGPSPTLKIVFSPRRVIV
jgi:hypothetical protein